MRQSKTGCPRSHGSPKWRPSGLLTHFRKRLKDELPCAQFLTGQPPTEAFYETRTEQAFATPEVCWEYNYREGIRPAWESVAVHLDDSAVAAIAAIVGPMNDSVWGEVERVLRAKEIGQEVVQAFKGFPAAAEAAWPDWPDLPDRLQSGWSLDAAEYPFNVIPGLPGGSCHRVVVLLARERRELEQRLDQGAAHVVRCASAGTRTAIAMLLTNRWDNSEYEKHAEVWRAIRSVYGTDLLVLPKTGKAFSGLLHPD